MLFKGENHLWISIVDKYLLALALLSLNFYYFYYSYYLPLNVISLLRYALCVCRPSGEVAIATIEPHSLRWIQSIAQVQYNCPRWQWCCRLICRLPTHHGQESQGRNVWLWTECSEEIPRGESVDKLCVCVFFPCCHVNRSTYITE